MVRSFGWWEVSHECKRTTCLGTLDISSSDATAGDTGTHEDTRPYMVTLLSIESFSILRENQFGINPVLERPLWCVLFSQVSSPPEPLPLCKPHARPPSMHSYTGIHVNWSTAVQDLKDTGRHTKDYLR